MKRMVPLLCTLLLLVTGFYMPRLASLALERRLESEVLQLENSGVSLTLSREADFFQALELFGGRHSQVELSEGYRMTAWQARSAAIRILQDLPVADTAYTDLQVKPVLLTSRDKPGLSGVFWRCAWQSADGISQELLWLDDQSGQLVSLRVRVGLTSMVKIQEDESLSQPPGRIEEYTLLYNHEPAKALADYCRQSYPADDVTLELENGDGNESDYTITLLRNRDEKTEARSILVSLQEEWLFFNS